MARARYVTDFERDCIRIGHAYGIENATIARAIGRTKAAVGQQIKRMTLDNTIGNLPLSFMTDEIAEMLRREGVKK